MTRETRRILYLLTSVERELYHAIGGVIPREIPPHVCEWHRPKGLSERYRVEQALRVKNHQQKPQPFAGDGKRKRRKAA